MTCLLFQCAVQLSRFLLHAVLVVTSVCVFALKSQIIRATRNLRDPPTPHRLVARRPLVGDRWSTGGRRVVDNFKMNIIDNNTSYIIPLDGIDLNYISKSYNANNGLPLWNINNQRSKEYYEFKLVAEKKEENVDKTYETGNYPTYQCQVCNLSIPLAYKKQHINSTKHKTCLKILEVAMDRAKLCLTQTQDDNTNVTIAPRSYFCEPCATVITNSNRKEHELSKDHFKSLMHDKFLNDLLKIYINKEHLDNIHLEYMSMENVNGANIQPSEGDEHDRNDSDFDTSDDNHDETDDINDFINLMKFMNDDESVKQNVDDATQAKLQMNKEAKIAEDKNKALSLTEYVAMLNRSSRSSSSPNIRVKGDKIEIETVDKTILSVFEDHFHGFSRSNMQDNNVLFCKLCLLSVKDENAHKMSPEHIKRLMTPILDSHGIRKVNRYNEHCVLCNHHLDDIESHKISETHINILKKASCEGAVKTNAPSNAVKKGKTYCQPCKVYIDTHNFEDHTKGRNHKMNVKLDEAKSDHSASTDTSATTSENNETKLCNTVSNAFDLDSLDCMDSTPPTYNLCRVCYVKVPKNHRNVKEHICSKKHRNAYKHFIMILHEIEEKNKRVYCKQCLEYVEEKTAFDHIEKWHTTTCRLCNINIINTRQAVEDHNNTISHRTNSKYKHDHLEIYDNYIKCKVCFKFMFNGVQDAVLHTDRTKHLEKCNNTLSENRMLRREDLYICTVCSIIIKGDIWIDHVRNSRHNERLKSCNPHKYTCIFCDCEVPYSEKNIDIHERSYIHKANVRSILNAINFDRSKQWEKLRTYVGI